MKALIYLLKTIIKNYFKQMKAKPQKVILPILGILWAVLIIFSGTKGKGATENLSELGAYHIQVFISIFLLVVIAITMFSLYSGTKKAKSRFDMSDVNLIFISPIKPQTVMLYGIIKQIHLELLGSIYILAQIPKLLRSMNVSGLKQGMFILSYIIFQVVLCNVIKLLVFSLSTKYKKVGSIIRNTIKAFILFTIICIIAIVIKGNTIESMINFSNYITYNPYVKYIPVIGWMKEIALQTLKEINLYYGVYLGLILLLSGVLIYIIYKMDIDFYEDMLSSVEDNELMNDIKSGKVKPGNQKQSFLTKPFKQAQLKLDNSYGAKVLFFKHMNEYFKKSFIFFINIYSIILLILSIAIGVFIKELDIRYILLATCVLLLFSSGFGGKIYSEVEYYFIFLIPDTSIRKLFYGVSSSLIKTFIDSLIIFIPFGILTKTPVFEMIFCILVYLTLGCMLSYSGLLTYRITGSLGLTGSITRGLVLTVFQILIVAPIFMLGLATIKYTYIFYIALIAYNLITSITFSLGSLGLFRDMEFSDN